MPDGPTVTAKSGPPQVLTGATYIDRMALMTDDTRWSTTELRAELNRYEEELRAAGKRRNTINTYVQHPERFINWLEGRYRPFQGTGLGRVSTGPSPAHPHRYGPVPPPPAQVSHVPSGRSRYEPLRLYLASRQEPVVRLSFADIERVIGARLPDSARRYRPWWANERAGSHVHATAWMGAGRRTANVDLNAGTVDFVR